MINRRGRLVQALRQAPVGILLIAAILLILAVGSIASGVFLMAETGALTWWAAMIALVGGPLILYLAYNLVSQVPWTWMALVVLLILLLLSSAVRLVVSPGIAPAGELLIELGSAFYLLRPRIRDRYRRIHREG